MLLNLSLGDSYGAVFEFATNDYIKENNDGLSYHHREGRIAPGIPGMYTDDTQMSIAIAEHMLDDQPATSLSYAHYFLKTHKRDPKVGYSKRMIAALTNSVDANSFIESIDTKFSSNGSVMRTVPLGLYKDPKEVIQRAIIQASTTHATLDAINSTVAISLMSHFLYHEIDVMENFIPWVSNLMGEHIFTDIWNAYKGGRVPCDAKQTASICIRIVYQWRNLSDILKKSISIGGDVDSVAAISLGLASLAKETVNDLPERLYNDMDNGIYGRDYIKGLDVKLFEKYPKI